MPANHDALDLIAPALAADGLVVAPVAGPGPWGALAGLRTAMRDLRRQGLAPHVSYVFAVARDGRIVPARGEDAALFVMAFRLGRRS